MLISFEYPMSRDIGDWTWSSTTSLLTNLARRAGAIESLSRAPLIRGGGATRDGLVGGAVENLSRALLMLGGGATCDGLAGIWRMIR